MMKKGIATLFCLLALSAQCAFAAKVNAEKTVKVGDLTRKYVLYVPNSVEENAPVVFSLHGASGHDTDRSPFRTSVADSQGCIVVYPQGVDQYFPVFGGYITGWNSTGAANEDLDFFKAIIEAVAADYSIDRQRIYCCGFSNGGMMTYSNSSSAADIFAAFASISGFQLNEFHHRPTGARPVPFMHIHGKADDFVKYSCMPIIRDNMVARNGCNPVPQVNNVAGKYTLSTYEAGEGGFPYVYYEIDGMGHSDYTDKTADGNSALTMWKFMSQYRLDDPCDSSLKWRLNIDTEDWIPEDHSWKVNKARTKYEYGTPKKANNLDNNVYPSLQFEAGCYTLSCSAEGTSGNPFYVKIETLDGSSTLLCKSAVVGKAVVMPFEVPEYTEYKITIVKTDPADKFTTFVINSTETLAEPLNSTDCQLPEIAPDPETGYLIEIPQDQGRSLDDFARTSMENDGDITVYTATADLQIAFKMVNIDVKDCDYVVVKFAEPVKAGWNVAFWDGFNTAAVPEGSSEYKFELEQGMRSSGVLPQLCMMTLFGGYQSPLVAKVSGVYKHSTLDDPNFLVPVESGASLPQSYYSVTGVCSCSPHRGINIVKMTDGTVRKVLYK